MGCCSCAAVCKSVLSVGLKGACLVSDGEHRGLSLVTTLIALGVKACGRRLLFHATMLLVHNASSIKKMAFG